MLNEFMIQHSSFPSGNTVGHAAIISRMCILLRYRLRTLLILMAIGPPTLTLVQELREAFRRSQCATSAELQTPICVFGIPTPLKPRIVPRQHSSLGADFCPDPRPRHERKAAQYEPGVNHPWPGLPPCDRILRAS
jgi:hypothetical protein